MLGLIILKGGCSGVIKTLALSLSILYITGY